MRQMLSSILVVAALVLTGCNATPSSPAAAPVTAPTITWPDGWPTDAFPAPFPGEKVIRTMQVGGSGMRYDAVALDSSRTLAEARAWLDVEGPKLAMGPQQPTDGVMAEVKSIFGAQGATISAVWARQDGDKMRAVALATERDRPVVIYVMRETNWTVRPLPADLPADIVLPLDAHLEALIVDLERGVAQAMLVTKSAETDVVNLIQTELVPHGYAEDASGKAVWRKNGVAVGVTPGAGAGTAVLVQYPIQKPQ